MNKKILFLKISSYGIETDRPPSPSMNNLPKSNFFLTELKSKLIEKTDQKSRILVKRGLFPDFDGDSLDKGTLDLADRVDLEKEVDVERGASKGTKLKSEPIRMRLSSCSSEEEIQQNGQNDEITQNKENFHHIDISSFANQVAHGWTNQGIE